MAYRGWIALVLGLAMAAGSMPAGADGQAEDVPAVPGEVVVTYLSAAPASARATARARAVGTLARRPARDVEVVRVPAGHEAAAVRALRADPSVRSAEPNRIFTSSGILPDDVSVSEQWGLHNVGQFGWGTPGSDIDAPAGWAIAREASSIVVAVVDTGIDATHPDLAGRISVEHPGWDWITGSSEPIDPHGHGTHVAGIIGAEAGNGVGVAGVAWDVQLVSLRVLNRFGNGTLADVAAAFRFAGAMGAHVVNASLGASGGSEPRAIRDAIADHPGTLYVVASGNQGRDVDGDPSWPCSISLPNLVCVTASDVDDRRAWFANVGSDSVHLAAPGVDVLSTYPGRTAGTTGSMALADSPDGFYRNDARSWARLDAPLDLSGSSGCAVSFDLRLQIESHDRLELQAQEGPDQAWTRLWSTSSSTGGKYQAITASLEEMAGASAARIRFRLVTDRSIVYDGSTIDNVAIACETGDPGLPPHTFEDGLAGWSTGGTNDTWGVTDRSMEYAYMSGTSMATPFVAGAAALLWSARTPGVGRVAWRRHIVNVLRGGADPARSWMTTDTAFGGRLNLARSLTYVGDRTDPDRAKIRTFGGRFQDDRRFDVRARGTDEGGAGLRSFDVRVRQASARAASLGTWSRLRTDDEASSRFRGKLGRTYCFQARARDNAFNLGDWGERRCTAVPLNDRQLSRAGGWTQLSPDAAYRGTAVRSKRRGARLTMTGVAARELALVATTCRGCGRVAVFHGGKRVGIVDLDRAFQRRRVIPVARFAEVRGPAKVRIVVRSTGKRVVIEGLGVGKV